MGRMNRPADKAHLEDLLDAALAGTFPASDPVSGLVSDRPEDPSAGASPKGGTARNEGEQQSD
jgi:hypothetical protein